VVVLRKIQIRYTIPAHTHPHANEWAYVLSGEWEESVRFTLVALCSSLPKERGMVPHIARTEVISFTIFDRPAHSRMTSHAKRTDASWLKQNACICRTMKIPGVRFLVVFVLLAGASFAFANPFKSKIITSSLCKSVPE